MKKLIIVVVIILVLIILAYGVYALSKSRTFQLFGELISRVDTDKKVVVLTFDDGPTKNTDKVVEILNEYNVKATFYLTGKEIEENMDKAKLIVNEGHEIGNHTYTHQRLVFKIPDTIKNEVEKTNDLIRQTGYNGEITFRPPGCKKLVLLPYYLSKNNIKTITWDLEPDSIADISNDSDKMVDYVLDNVKPGSIILMHVMYKSREASMNALPEIIKGLKEKGYEFLKIGDLIKS